MAFEWFPILHGRFLTFREYLALSGTLALFIVFLYFWFTLQIYKWFVEREIKRKKDALIADEALYSSLNA